MNKHTNSYLGQGVGHFSTGTPAEYSVEVPLDLAHTEFEDTAKLVSDLGYDDEPEDFEDADTVPSVRSARQER